MLVWAILKNEKYTIKLVIKKTLSRITREELIIKENKSLILLTYLRPFSDLDLEVKEIEEQQDRDNITIKIMVDNNRIEDWSLCFLSYYLFFLVS